MEFPDLVICAVDEIDRYKEEDVTHIVSIRNPGAPGARPTWFNGAFLELFFGDVVSPTDAQACKTLPATSEHIRDCVAFSSLSFNRPASKTVFFCDYGASRSPAMAYVALAAHLGPGREEECFQKILSIREEAVPNPLVVSLGDQGLQRGGRLIAPHKRFFDEFFGGIS